MKKKFALLAILLIPLALWAADPAHEGYSRSVGSVTVDTTFDASTTYWEPLGSGIVFVVSDGATVLFNVDGIAIMDPGDKLWLGIGNDTIAGIAFPDRNIDSTVILYPLHNKGVAYVPFSFSASFDTAAATDTAFFTAACGGHGNTDPVQLKNVVIKVNIIDSVLAL